MRVYKSKSLDELLWPRVDRTGIDQCWMWKAWVRWDGYGQFHCNRKAWTPHRAAYHLVKGPIPPGMVVMHTCDQPLCCNPEHLRIGTHADNTADKLRKGRNRRGETSPQAKLTEADVREIRRLYRSGPKNGPNRSNGGALARRFGVCQSQISQIVRRLHWAHVTD